MTIFGDFLVAIPAKAGVQGAVAQRRGVALKARSFYGCSSDHRRLNAGQGVHGDDGARDDQAQGNKICSGALENDVHPVQSLKTWRGWHQPLPRYDGVFPSDNN